MADDIADFIGRRLTIIMGCFIFSVGCILETASTTIGVMVAGRLVARFGVGFISAIIILYMSEIAPRKVRGALVSGKVLFVMAGTFLTLILSLRLSTLYRDWDGLGQLHSLRFAGP